ncbi:MAG: hypothetical protein WC047_02635 [Kiritimatiellales bacterium]
MKYTIFVSDAGIISLVNTEVDQDNNLIILHSDSQLQGPLGWLWDAEAGNIAHRFRIMGGEISISPNQHTQCTKGQLLDEKQSVDIATLLDPQKILKVRALLDKHNQNNP